MAYMTADTSNKVGFRPYAATNPQGAANLSGLGQGHNPFTPQAWHLHPGLGDYLYNRPLDPWELHASDHPMLHGYFLGDLGDSSGNAGTDDQVAQAADDLLSAGGITQAEHDAILNGSMSFQDVLGYDPTDQSSWVNAVSLLQQWNSQLQAIESQVAAANLQNLNSGAQPSVAFQSLAAQVNTQRQQYESLAQQFINMYRTVTGSVPAGLTGLGIAIAVWVVGAAAVLVAVYFGYQGFQTWKASINVAQTIANTQQQAVAVNQQQVQSQATTMQALATQLAAAQAKGDTTTANSIIAAMNKIGAPIQVGTPQGAPMTALEAWITSNAMWLALGAGALVMLPNLFGGGRRR